MEQQHCNEDPVLPFLLQSPSRVFNLNSFCDWLYNTSSELQVKIKHVDVRACIGVLASLHQRVEVDQFAFGQSNPTFLVKVYPDSTKDSYDEGCRVLQLVLRQKPSKLIHESAHAIHREFAVLLSLSHC
jgi:hypothetical protein